MKRLLWHGFCFLKTGIAGVPPALTTQPKGDKMEPLNVAARFAAFTCYLNTETRGSCSPEDAGRFARNNWKRFLPYVHENLGRFLTSQRPSVSGRTGQRFAPGAPGKAKAAVLSSRCSNEETAEE
jgi:hypothetical protein